MRPRVFAVPLLLPLAAVTAMAQQQTRVVTGTVTNTANNQPLSDITVSAVGTTSGGITDAQGRFRIVIPAGDQILAARGIGYKRITQRVPAGVATAAFRLERDVLQLDQVTVTGQTTTLSTRNATTAVSVVNTEEVTRAPAQSLEQALQGKVLGAKIDMNSGAPGGGAQIQIRGASSVLGNSQPHRAGAADRRRRRDHQQRGLLLGRQLGDRRRHRDRHRPGRGGQPPRRHQPE